MNKRRMSRRDFVRGRGENVFSSLQWRTEKRGSRRGGTRGVGVGDVTEFGAVPPYFRDERSEGPE